MLQATNDEFHELANALLGASHLLLRHRLGRDPEPAAFLVLSLVGRGASLRPSDVAAAMRLDQSTISRHVQALEADGYLAKVKDPRDGRCCCLKVTAAGRAAIDAAMARRAEFFRQATKHWPRTDFRTLVALLDRLAADLKARADS
jgi:DNA-binding MarR family transcriptional regulator